jgi:hypothetical protein
VASETSNVQVDLKFSGQPLKGPTGISVVPQSLSELILLGLSGAVESSEKSPTQSRETW